MAVLFPVIKTKNHLSCGMAVNLNIPRYVDTFEPEPEVDIPAVQPEIEYLEQQLAETREKMDGYLNELGLDK